MGLSDIEAFNPVPDYPDVHRRKRPDLTAEGSWWKGFLGVREPPDAPDVLQVPTIHVGESVKPLRCVVSDLPDSEHLASSEPQEDDVATACLLTEPPKAVSDVAKMCVA